MIVYPVEAREKNSAEEIRLWDRAAEIDDFRNFRKIGVKVAVLQV